MPGLKKTRFFKYCLLWAAVSFFLLLGQGNERLMAGKYSPVVENETSSLENLLKAYNIESNDYNLYRAFSEKAQKEGHPGIAYLFRAVSEAINVQKENHAEAIKTMKGTPKSDLKTPVVQSTEENLQIAIKEESAKYTDLYPVFLKKAREERNKIALRTFNFSKSAAEGQFKFLTQASASLEAWEKEKRNFRVCSICGNMVTALNFSECPICFNPLDKYFQVK